MKAKGNLLCSPSPKSAVLQTQEELVQYEARLTDLGKIELIEYLIGLYILR